MKDTESLRQLVELHALDLWLDLYRWVGAMLEAGYGYLDVGSYILPLAAGSTVELEAPNPAGYAWIPIEEEATADTEGVVSLTQMRDNRVFAYMPAVYNFKYSWNIAPYAGVARESVSISLTNPDVADHWFIGMYIGAYIKTDRYEAFKRMLNLATTKYGGEILK